MVICRWVYAIKVDPNEVNCFKTPLVVKGYTQIYSHDYSITLSSVANMTIVCLFFGMVAIRH